MCLRAWRTNFSQRYRISFRCAESVLNEAQRGSKPVPSAHVLAARSGGSAFVPTADIPSDTAITRSADPSSVAGRTSSDPAHPWHRHPGSSRRRHGNPIRREFPRFRFSTKSARFSAYRRGTPLPAHAASGYRKHPTRHELQALVNSFSSTATPEVTESVPGADRTAITAALIPAGHADFSAGYSLSQRDPPIGTRWNACWRGPVAYAHRRLRPV